MTADAASALNRVFGIYDIIGLLIKSITYERVGSKYELAGAVSFPPSLSSLLLDALSDITHWRKYCQGSTVPSNLK